MTTSFPAAPLTQPAGAPPAFHLLAKPTGAICNLDCAYCFFLDKEVFYPGSKFRMSDDVLEQYIRQLIESHQTDSVNIAWQGGEPTLMGLDFFRRAMALVEKYRRPGMTSCTPCRPTARCWTTSGRPSSRSTAFSSASASTGRANCTTSTAWTRGASPPSTG